MSGELAETRGLTREEAIGAVAALERLVVQLQQQITGYQMHEQTIAAKFRNKISALEQELTLAQKGLTSGCGCPIGRCVRKEGDGSSCWLQWAEAHILRRMGDIRVSQLIRHGNHPSRHQQIEQQQLAGGSNDAEPTDQGPA